MKCIPIDSFIIRFVIRFYYQKMDFVLGGYGELWDFYHVQQTELWSVRMFW